MVFCQLVNGPRVGRESSEIEARHVSHAGPTVSDVTYTNGAEASKAAGVKEDWDAVKME